MDKVYSEVTEQKEFTEGTNKRRISSILKASRTPLQDLGSGNELPQACVVEKSQKNSRRVSFAETISVFPSDPQTVVALDHAGPAEEANIQNQFNQIEKPKDVLCNIAGMTTLLHAPIQTPLQQTECHNINTGQDSSKMDRTQIFSEENEMDMTSGHTIMINHAVGSCQETESTKKIDFRSFSAELKQVPPMNEFSFSGCTAKINETSLSLQKTNAENTNKINFDDFLKSLKSTEVFYPPTASNIVSSERNMSSSEKNVCSQLQENNCNVASNFGRPTNWQDYITSLLPNQKTTTSPTWHISKQLGCGEINPAFREENTDVIAASTERTLPPGNGLLNINQNQAENLGNNNKNYKFKTSTHQQGVQQNSNMHVNEINVNNNGPQVVSTRAVGITSKHVPQDCYLMPSKTGAITSRLVLPHDENTSLSNISVDMEVTTNCTGLIWDEKFSGTDHISDGTYETQRNNTSLFIKGSVPKEKQIHNIENQVPVNSYLNSQGTAPNQKADWGKMEQLNATINPGLWTSCLPETKENALLASLPNEKVAALSSTNSHLNRSLAAKSYEEQTENRFSCVPDDKQGAHTIAVDNQAGRKHGISVNATSLIPIDKRPTFTFHEDMEIINLAPSLIGNSPNPVRVQNMPEQEVGAAKKNINCSNSNKTCIFSLTGDNEMEITKNCTAAINYNIIHQCKRNPQGLYLQPRDNIYTCPNDMDETKAIMSVDDQPIENGGTQAVQKLNNVTGTRAHIGSPKDKTIVFTLAEENEMEITRSHTVVLNHDSVTQNEDISIRPIICSDKMAMGAYSEDMKIAKPIACVTDKSLRTITDRVVPEHGIRSGKKNVSGFSSEKSVVFSVSENNEMELTRSLTVKVEGAFQAVSQISGEKTNTSVCGGNMASTTFFSEGNNMEITQPVTHIKNASKRSTDLKALLLEEQNRKVILASAVGEKTMCFQHEDNEMEFTRSHTVTVNNNLIQQINVATQGLSSSPAANIFSQSSSAAVEGTFQAGPQISGEKINTSVCSAVMEGTFQAGPQISGVKTNTSVSNGNMAVTKSTTFFSEDNDMEITQPVTYINNVSLSTDLKALSQEEHNRKVTLPSAVGEKTICFQNKDNEMEFTRSHTVTVNNNLFQQRKVTTQGLSSSPAYEANIFTPSSSAAVTNSSGFIPAEKTMMFMCNNDMEMTKPLWDKNTCFQAVPQRGKETGTDTLPGSFKDHTAALALQNNEMEITKCHTVALNHDIITQSERTPQVLVCQNSTGSEFVTVNTNESWQKETRKLGKYAGREPSTEQIRDLTMVDDTEIDRSHTMLRDNRRDLSSQLTNQDKLHFPYNKTDAHSEAAMDCDTVSCGWDSSKKGLQNILNSAPINNFPLEEMPAVLPKSSGVTSDCPKLKETVKKSELVLLSHNIGASPEEELSELTVKPYNPSGLENSIKNESTIPIASNEQTNVSTEDAPLAIPFSAMYKNSCTIKKVPLSIFPPKLPNKRKSAVVNVENISTRSEGRNEPEGSETPLFIKRDKTIQSLNPSSYIDEEQPPAYLEEMNSNESLNCEVPEKLMDLYNEKGIVDKEGHLSEGFEPNNTQKRAWCQEDVEFQQEKRLKVDEGSDNTASLNQPPSPTVITHIDEGTHEGKSIPDLITTNLEKTQSSNSSSLDTVKTDADFSIQQDGKMGNQFLIDSICEQNLQEKLQGGSITVREFFTLLQVHVVIQKPRQSLLPPKYAVNAAPTTEDEILSQYIYHPKLQVYDENCQTLCKTIEELKSKADDQDKLLVNVNKSLWEVMRTCSDEELEGFGAELNKMKSGFTKMSKVLAHRRKTELYTKLVQKAQLQWKELLSKLAKMDELLKEIDSCLDALETETEKLEESELDVSSVMAESESKLRETEKELENYRAQEEAQEREQSNIRNQNQQLISEINHLQEDANKCQELMEKYKFSEWVMKEWNDQQAVFTFLYDSVELTVGLGYPGDNAMFRNMFGLKIVSMEFESLLDEAEASPSSKLVHRLIFQFINSQTLWREKSSTVHRLCQVLHDVSLVVTRCKLLGEEIDFLDRWGGKFNLMKIEVNDTKVKLLFSSSIPFAKFEIELLLSASYPATPIAFMTEKCTGNLSQEEISAVLLNVPVGAGYLKRIVNQIHQTLIQCRSRVCKE